MGIILLPFLLIAVVLYVKTAIAVYKGIRAHQIDFKIVFIGVIIALLIYGLIFFNYYLSSEAYAFGAYFVFLFFMIILPYSFTGFLKKAQNKSSRMFYFSLSVSILLSGLSLLILNKYTFGIAEFLQIPKHY